MDVHGVGGKAVQVMEKAQRLVEQVPQQVQEFEVVLESLRRHNTRPSEVLNRATPEPENVPGPTRGEGLYREKLRQAREPDGIERLLGDIEQAHRRLSEIVREVQGGKSFTPQELLGLQAEMHRITLQLEVTTKVVAQVVSGVKQLLQQQV